MRILIMLVLLVVAGPAWADALKVKVKDEKNSREYRHNGHGSRVEWDRRTGNHRSQSHHSGKKGHGKHWENWRRAEQFRTRRSNKSESVIYINAEVSAISLRGIKRHAAIYEVYAELGNGRLIPLRDLEGALHRGDSFTRHFNKSRYVRKLFLHVGPQYRRQRAYVSVDYLPSKTRGRRGHENSHERGYKNSHERGYKNSHERGHKNSHERGYKNSHERGHKNSHERGYKDSHERGHKNSPERGYKDSHERGHKNSPERGHSNRHLVL